MIGFEGEITGIKPMKILPSIHITQSFLNYCYFFHLLRKIRHIHYTSDFFGTGSILANIEAIK